MASEGGLGTRSADGDALQEVRDVERTVGAAPPAWVQTMDHGGLEGVWGGGWCVGRGRRIFYFLDLCTELQVRDYPRDLIDPRNQKTRYNPSENGNKHWGLYGSTGD